MRPLIDHRSFERIRPMPSPAECIPEVRRTSNRLKRALMSGISISTDPLQGHWWGDNPLAGIDSLESDKKREGMGTWSNSWSRKSPRKTRSDEDLRPRNDATSVANITSSNRWLRLSPDSCEDPAVISKILSHLGLPTRRPTKSSGPPRRRLPDSLIPPQDSTSVSGADRSSLPSAPAHTPQ